MTIVIDRADGLASSTAYKGPCRVATLANVALSGLAVIDGVQLVLGDRVVVRAQTDARENGIYVVSTGNWRRSADFNNNRDIRKGTRVWVTDGDSGPAELEVTSDNPIAIGTTEITFELSAGSANAVALSQAVKDAEEWAQSPDPISIHAGGDGSTDQSSKTWALRSEVSADLAEGYASDAVSQGNVPIYASVLSVQGLQIPPGISAIRVNGYAAPGDGGTALYKRVASEPSHAGKIQSADGAWWELAEAAKTPQMFDAVADGVADDTTSVEEWDSVDGIRLAPTGNYLIPGTPAAPSRPRIVLADDAQVSGVAIPFISVGTEAFNTLPRNYLFIQQNTGDRDDPTTVQIQRTVTTDDGITNPKALRVLTHKQGGGGNQIEWAVSGEVINDDNSGTAQEGGTAVSGVSLKNAAGTGVMFGGHFQVKDATDAPTEGGIVGIECNIQANGPDTNANRVGFDLIARSFPTGVSGPGQFTAGLRVRNSSTVGGGRWLIGIQVKDGNQTVPTAISLENSPGTGGNGLKDTGSKDYAISLEGTYAAAAIKIPSQSYIAMEGTNAIKMAYGVAASIWGFYNTTNERVGFNMTASPNIRISANKVVGARMTGWQNATGTATRTTFDTSTVTLQQLAERVKALIDDVHASTSNHGLIGT